MATAVLLPGITACVAPAELDVRALVRRYNSTVIEAYRRSDVRFVDTVVAPDSVDGRRLTGLIGVKSDAGIFLDAELVGLEVTEARREGNRLEARSREAWRYCDRRLGTGEIVGEPTLDEYEVVYEFSLIGGAWLVERTRFAAPPRVGRSPSPMRVPVAAHSGRELSRGGPRPGERR